MVSLTFDVQCVNSQKITQVHKRKCCFNCDFCISQSLLKRQAISYVEKRLILLCVKIIVFKTTNKASSKFQSSCQPHKVDQTKKPMSYTVGQVIIVTDIMTESCKFKCVFHSLLLYLQCKLESGLSETFSQISTLAPILLI